MYVFTKIKATKRSLCHGSVFIIGLACAVWMPILAAKSADGVSDDYQSIKYSTSKQGYQVAAIVEEHGPYLFIIDSGLSQRHLLSQRVATDLGLSPSRSTTAMTASGPQDVTLSNVESIKLGELEIGPAKVAIFDFPTEFEKSFDSALPFGGILGAILLKDYSLSFSPTQQSLTLNKGCAGDSSGLVVAEIPLVGRGGGRFINGRVAGHSVKLAIDTGAETALMLFEDVAKKLYISNRFGPGEAVTLRGGNGKKIDAVKITIPQMDINGNYFYDIETIILPRSGNKFFQRDDGHIGRNFFLSAHSYQIDYPCSRIRLFQTLTEKPRE